ncbi:hypothetical protein GGS24DRAFT_474194 [Hypoxylon argillaceum]|nr:hypothetical protein GGS24DRAFT_474194 [Hypoxylon argillaceum]
MVFLPISTTASLRRDCRTSCICCELTLSTVTMKTDLYSSSSALSLGNCSNDVVRKNADTDTDGAYTRIPPSFPCWLPCLLIFEVRMFKAS